DPQGLLPDPAPRLGGEHDAYAALAQPRGLGDDSHLLPAPAQGGFGMEDRERHEASRRAARAGPGPRPARPRRRPPPRAPMPASRPASVIRAGRGPRR